MTTRKAPRCIKRTCPYCAREYDVAASRRRFEPWDNCQAAECMRKGTDDYNAARAAYDADPQREVERAARRAARNAPPVVIGGGWAQVGQLMAGLDRKARQERNDH